MLEKISNLQNYNRNLKQTNVIRNNQTDTIVTEPQADTVSFRGTKKTATGLMDLFAKMLLGGATGTGVYFLNQTSLEDVAREEFKTMRSVDWLFKYSYEPELLKKLLLEKDNFNGVEEERLYHVPQGKVIQIFSKNPEIIYDLVDIVTIEQREKNNYSQSLIELLGEKTPEFLDKVLLKQKVNGHHLLSHSIMSDHLDGTLLLKHLHNAYSKRLDVLAKMYMTKDEGLELYPLEHARLIPSLYSKKILEELQITFEDRPDLLIPILETSGFEELANKIKEEESVDKPMKFLLKTDLSKEIINQTLDSLDESTRETLIDGLKNRDFHNIKDSPAIKELYEEIRKQTEDDKTAAELTFKTLAKFFSVSKDFDSNEKINFYMAIRDIKENGIKITDTKNLKVDKSGCVSYEYPDKTVIRKTEDIFEYIEDKTKKRVVEHIGRYTYLPNKADKIETYDENGNLIKKWDETGNVTEYYSNGRLVKRVMPNAVEHFDSEGKSDCEGGWADW